MNGQIKGKVGILQGKYLAKELLLLCMSGHVGNMNFMIILQSRITV